jgi:hypothetical protein
LRKSTHDLPKYRDAQHQCNWFTTRHLRKVNAIMKSTLALLFGGLVLTGAAHAAIVAMDVEIILDQVAPDEKNIAVGQHHEARVFFDDTKIDPVTHRVALLHEQHTPALIPKHLNPAQMPMSNAWLDFSGPAIRYHYAAAPTVAIPFTYFILFDETNMRMTIRRQSDGMLLLAGPYKVNPKKIMGPEIDAVVASSEPVIPPWETKLKFPDMPKLPPPSTEARDQDKSH